MGLEKKLFELRKRHGMSQQELAEKLDVSRQSISKWELGTAAPSTENLIHIGKLFGVSIDVLVDDRLEIQPPPVSQIKEEETMPGVTDAGAAHGDGASTEDFKPIAHAERYQNIVQAILLVSALSVCTFLCLDAVENFMFRRNGTVFYVPLSMISEVLQVIGCGMIGFRAGLQYKNPKVSVLRAVAWTAATFLLLWCTVQWCVLFSGSPFDYFRTSISDQLYFQSIFIQFLFAKVTNPIIAPAFLCGDILFWCAILKNRGARKTKKREEVNRDLSL